MVKKAKENKEIKFCPRCKSENIGTEVSDAIIADYCKDCGYNSRLNDIQKNLQFPIKSKTKRK